MGQPHVDHLAVAGGAARRLREFAWAAATAGLALAWWALTVHFNYGGHWTALFCTGEHFPPPPALAAERIYIFKGSNGFDGQFYHYVAHDPLFRHGLWQHLDLPAYRARRILTPGLAWLLALGQAHWIDAAYRAVTLAWVFLGAWWLGRLAGRPLGGVGFLLVPAVLVSLDRLTVDIALAALCVAFAVYAREGPSWRLYLVLAAAGLARETGLLLAAAYCAAAALEGQRRRAALFATAALPALGWFAWVTLRLPSGPGAALVSWIPLRGALLRLAHAPSYALAWPVAASAHALDYLAVGGALLGVWLAGRLAWRRPLGALEAAALAFALVAVFLAPGDPWESAYSFGRTLTPLVLLVALEGIGRGAWAAVAPALMITPRILLQLAPQALGIARGLLGVA